MKSRFVSMASHEFRTPLTTMLSSLSLVMQYGAQNDVENQARHVRKIKSSIHNLTDILNDFLSVSQLEEGKVENAPKELNIRLFVEEILAEMQGMLRPDQQFVHHPTGDGSVLLDPKLLKNILFNLLSNSIKFSPEGGEIAVETTVSGETVTIVVKDPGIGIPEKEQQHLFERFFRGHNAAHIQGTGLGLSIVSRYVELMNGSIRINSKERQGTRITLELPRTRKQGSI
jgi:signal transduction histidine kinase